MAKDFIPLNRKDDKATLANDIKGAVESIRTAMTQLGKVVDIMHHNFDDGQSIDWTQVETISGVKAGDGHELFALLDGVRNALNGSDAPELISRVG